MWLDNTCQEAIRLFWERCGATPDFPRHLESCVALALPVTIVKLPCLKLHLIEHWLVQRGVAYQFNCHDRAVHGCLVAFGGSGLVFVDGTDPLDEQRFTIAHEVAHFVLDYWVPREKAVNKFGPEITAVFDGLRPPGLSERVQALLTEVPLGVYTRLLERDETRDVFTADVWRIEDRADRVALALLAPPEMVLAQSDLMFAYFTQRQHAMQARLMDVFGLPAAMASVYAYQLLASSGRGPSWTEALRAKLGK